MLTLSRSLLGTDQIAQMGLILLSRRLLIDRGIEFAGGIFSSQPNAEEAAISVVRCPLSERKRGFKWLNVVELIPSLLVITIHEEEFCALYSKPCRLIGGSG